MVKDRRETQGDRRQSESDKERKRESEVRFVSLVHAQSFGTGRR